jgi:hypothetical protein
VITISATATVYCQYVNPTIMVPQTITGFTLTLDDTLGATGTRKGVSGQWIRIRRQGSGAASGTLVVTNGGAGGGNLTITALNGTAPAEMWFIFDGTNWAVDATTGVT